MKKIKIPIIFPTGLKPIITQPYGDTANAAFYQENGIKMAKHNGTDFTSSGNNRQTYGCPVITPSEGWLVKKVFNQSDAMSPNGNEAIIHSPSFDEDGVQKVIELRLVHLSKVNEELEGKIVPAGTVVGYIGNSGLVSPKPSLKDPYAGTHLHLGMIEYKAGSDGILVNPNFNNGLYGLLDPMTRLDITLFDTAPEDISKDSPPVQWAFEQAGISSVFEKLMYVLKLFKFIK